MKVSHASFADPVDIPHTWRRWWDGRPKWMKVAVWTGVGAIVLQVAIAVRIWIGLMDTPEMARIREAGGQLRFYSTSAPPRGLLREWRDGFWGRSNGEVESIQLKGGATGELVAFIVKEFPNLAGLKITESPISADALMGLEQLNKLILVDFRATNLDDRAARILGKTKSLRYVCLDETFVSMATVEELDRQLTLSLLQVAGTNVTQNEMQRWLQANGSAYSYVLSGLDRFGYLLPGSIRWLDGSVTGIHDGLVKLDAECVRADGETCTPMTMERTSFTRGQVLEMLGDLANGADGNYRFVLTINGHVSTPVTFQVMDGHPSIQQIEFVMPIDEATARSLGPK